MKLQPKSPFPAIVAACFVRLASAAGPTPEEMTTAGTWMQTHFGPKASAQPFSFVYGGRPSADLLKEWKQDRVIKQLDGSRTEHNLTWTDPATGLVLRCAVTEYKDYPTVEWTLNFKNTASGDSPILSDIKTLDVRLERGPHAEFTLHHQTGALATPQDYQPFQTVLGPKAEKHIATSGGRPTNSNLPYFNIEWPGEGVIAAIGWPGQWAADFSRNETTALRVRAGQEATHFKLLPDEEVRSPIIVLQFYKGDRIRSQNTWRRWMLAHNMPRPGGALPPPQLVACSSHQFGEMIDANETNQKLFIDRYLQEGLKIDYWWMDAGWYVNNGSWVNTGTWEVDAKRFPRGLRAITDHAHSKGVRSIVWFEPERVTKGSWLYEHHPEWLLAPPPNPGSHLYDKDWRLLNLGDPEARRWLTDHIDRLITDQGIDLYRQDFNLDPLLFWRAGDATDRQGITEIRYVSGYLAYWDELRRRHPAMLIDSCASGGRRNDLETLRRAVPLIRSDHLFEPTSQQCHMYGIAFWIPFNGTGTLVGPSRIVSIASSQVDPYVFRSNMAPNVTACWDMRRTDLDYAQLRRLTGQLHQVAPCFLGDYYPLTPYTLDNNVWMAWQFDRPESGEGFVQAFRRPDSTNESVRTKLQGLDPQAQYSVTDLDAGKPQELSGRELLETGLAITIPSRPGAVVITYQKVK